MSTKKQGYKQLLLEAKSMRQSAGSNAYDRAVILMKVFDDREFRADNGNVDDFALADVLDAYCEDLSFGFLDLKALIEHFPQREQWSDGLLRRMYTEMLDAREKVDVGERKVPQRRASLKQLEAAERRVVELEAAVQRMPDLEAQNARLQEEVMELREESRRLRASYTRALDRISDLESKLDQRRSMSNQNASADAAALCA